MCDLDIDQYMSVIAEHGDFCTVLLTSFGWEKNRQVTLSHPDCGSITTLRVAPL